MLFCSSQVLSSVMSDKSLDRFRQEYEKLHTALKKVGVGVIVRAHGARGVLVCVSAVLLVLGPFCAFYPITGLRQ